MAVTEVAAVRSLFFSEIIFTFLKLFLRLKFYPIFRIFLGYTTRISYLCRIFKIEKICH